jgi:hypothetical protein
MDVESNAGPSVAIGQKSNVTSASQTENKNLVRDASHTRTLRRGESEDIVRANRLGEKELMITSTVLIVAGEKF